MLLIKYRLINAFGLIVSFLPAVIATYQYYPAIVDATSSVWDRIGVGTIIAAVLVMAVMVRYASVKFPSPTPDVIFLILWVVCELLKKVITPMSDILFWAVVGAFAGRIILTASELFERRELRRMGIEPKESKKNGGK
jgi:hypothetical protein